MGLRRIGRRIRRGFRRIGRGFGRIAKFGSKAFGIITKPLSMITKPLQGIVGKVLGALPFGKVLAPFVQAFMGNPLALMNPATLGGLGSFLGAAQNLGQVNQLVQQVAPMAAFASPEGRMNLLQMTARQHASFLIPRG